MNFQIKFSKQSGGFIRNLPENIYDRIKLKFAKIAKNPFRYLQHYEGQYSYKLRIGDYRALIDVALDEKVLFVRVLDKRSRIYKR